MGGGGFVVEVCSVAAVPVRGGMCVREWGWCGCVREEGEG